MVADARFSSRPAPEPKSGPSESVKADASDRRCPICKAVVDTASPAFPFCSKRCRTIDLGKWIKGDYLISRPIEEEDLDQDD